MKEYDYKAFLVKKDVDSKLFMKNALTALANDPSTPVDIFESEFGKIEEKELEFVIATADTDISYSCSVGYDREEKYREWDNVNKKYIEKTRTVTDWQPHFGENKSKEAALSYNGVLDESLFPNLVVSTKGNKTMVGWVEIIADLISNELPVVEFDEQEAKEKYPKIDEKCVSKIKEECIDNCFNKVNLPGDRQKNISNSGSVQFDEMEKWIMPMYTTKYKYKDEEYRLCGLACGNEFLSKPQPIGRTCPAEPVSIGKLAMKSAKWIMLSALLPIILAVIVTLLNVKDVLLPCILGALGLLVVGIIVYCVKKKEILKVHMQVKRNKLTEYLNKHNLNDNSDKKEI